ANAEVSLWIVDLDGARQEVEWDRGRFPYLARVVWPADSPLTLLVQSRDQRATRVMTADGAVVREDTDPAWVELVGGTPAWLPDGRLVHCADRDGWRRLVIGDRWATPPGLQVRHVVHTDEAGVIVAASDDPTEVHLWHVAADGGEGGPV